MRWLAAGWVVFFTAFVWEHRRTRRCRDPKSPPENRVARDRSSDLGMALQFGAALLGWILSRGPLRWFWAPLAMEALGCGLVWWSLRTLGRQWRLQAVVTDDHELITTGPYALVRHPLYLAFSLMVAGWTAATNPAWNALACAALFALGTEIRIRAEDRLLARTFGAAFEAYRRKVRAWIPFAR